LFVGGVAGVQAGQQSLPGALAVVVIEAANPSRTTWKASRLG